MRRRGQAGLTLIELMISLGIMVLIGLGTVFAYDAAVKFETDTRPRITAANRFRRIETKIATYLRRAYLGGATGGSAPTYFVASASGQSTWSAGLGDLADSLVFTSTGVSPSDVYLQTEDEFEDLNSEFGPQGGVIEVAFAPVPYGDAGDQAGPFLRTQRPADGDPTQGGWESVLDPDLAGLSFEFWDGTTWVPEWDSNAMTPPRLPAAVRVSYALVGEEDMVKTFVVRVELSDVTPENPAGIGTISGGGP